MNDFISKLALNAKQAAGRRLKQLGTGSQQVGNSWQTVSKVNLYYIHKMNNLISNFIKERDILDVAYIFMSSNHKSALL